MGLTGEPIDVIFLILRGRFGAPGHHLDPPPTFRVRPRLWGSGADRDSDDRMVDMRVGVVIDATCDLPHSYIESHGLIVLPGHVEFGDASYTDVREPEETLRWYRRHIGDKSTPGRSVAWGIERIRDLFLEDLIFRFDRVLVLCVSASRGRVFSHATQASYQILKGYRERREAVGQTEPFALRVLDTRNERLHAVIVLRADRIKLMVVASRTTDA